MDTGNDASATDEFASRLTKWLEGLVELLRDRAVRPILLAARAVVLGGLVFLLGAALAAAATIGMVRLFDKDVFAGRAWATYLLFGGIFALAGLFLLRRSERAERPDART